MHLSSTGIYIYNGCIHALEPYTEYYIEIDIYKSQNILECEYIPIYGAVWGGLKCWSNITYKKLWMHLYRFFVQFHQLNNIKIGFFLCGNGKEKVVVYFVENWFFSGFVSFNFSFYYLMALQLKLLYTYVGTLYILNLLFAIPCTCINV